MPASHVDKPYTATHESKRSRFIGWCSGIDGIEDAYMLRDRSRQHHPDASHHCSAWIAGPPGDNRFIGFDDDGEPGGTAGRPMFHVLKGSGLGCIACVVIRYFGGLKLGTGGLARAYAQTVSEALAVLSTQTYVPRQRLSLGLTFADEQPARAWLATYEARIVEATYHANGVTLVVDWPLDARTELAELDVHLHGRVLLDDSVS